MEARLLLALSVLASAENPPSSNFHQTSYDITKLDELNAEITQYNTTAGMRLIVERAEEMLGPKTLFTPDQGSTIVGKEEIYVFDFAMTWQRAKLSCNRRFSSLPYPTKPRHFEVLNENLDAFWVKIKKYGESSGTDYQYSQGSYVPVFIGEKVINFTDQVKTLSTDDCAVFNLTSLTFQTKPCDSKQSVACMSQATKSENQILQYQMLTKAMRSALSRLVGWTVKTAPFIMKVQEEIATLEETDHNCRQEPYFLPKTVLPESHDVPSTLDFLRTSLQNRRDFVIKIERLHRLISTSGLGVRNGQLCFVPSTHRPAVDPSPSFTEPSTDVLPSKPSHTADYTEENEEQKFAACENFAEKINEFKTMLENLPPDHFFNITLVDIIIFMILMIGGVGSLAFQVRKYINKKREEEEVEEEMTAFRITGQSDHHCGGVRTRDSPRNRRVTWDRAVALNGHSRSPSEASSETENLPLR